jgi:hypothetical protein
MHVYGNIAKGTSTIHRASADFHIVKPASGYFIFAVQEYQSFLIRKQILFWGYACLTTLPSVEVLLCVQCSPLRVHLRAYERNYLWRHFLLEKEKLSCSISIESTTIYNKGLRVFFRCPWILFSWSWNSWRYLFISFIGSIQSGKRAKRLVFELKRNKAS